MRRNFEKKLDYKSIRDIEFKVSSINTEDFNGNVHLASIHKVDEPITRTIDEKTIKIIDNGYKWLQITPTNANYNLITIIDEKEQILQWEFVIVENTDQNSLMGLEELFLSLLVLPNGFKEILGEGEIKEALHNKEIDICRYERAYREVKILAEIVSIDKLIGLSHNMLMYMKDEKLANPLQNRMCENKKM